MADMKKPATAYFLWLNATREQIQKDVGSKSFGDVARKASEMWKSMSAAAKQPWEARAKEEKDAFEKFKATEAGQKALLEKKEARAEAREEKEKKSAKRDAKAAKRSVEKDERLKKPMSAYFLFCNDKREEVIKMLGTGKGPIVTKKITEMWAACTDAQKKPYQDRNQKEREAYDAYIKTPEGAAALKEYREGVQEAKAEVVGKRKAEADSPEEKSAKMTKAGA